MKLREVSVVIKGAHIIDEPSIKKRKLYKELTMLSLEPISFIDERKLIDVSLCHKLPSTQLTKAGDVVVSLYHPMIACYVEKGQEGYVVPHYMALIRMKPHTTLDSRFIVQFINSSRGRGALLKTSQAFQQSRPTSLPIMTLNEVELLQGVNQLLERF